MLVSAPRRRDSRRDVMPIALAHSRARAHDDDAMPTPPAQPSSKGLEHARCSREEDDVEARLL